jgi:hypothetical protein
MEIFQEVVETAGGVEQASVMLEVTVAIIEAAAAMDLISARFLWEPVDDNQSGSWTPVDDAQGGSWTPVDDAQPPGWTPVVTP